ncbi:MAG: outer membrane protein transport protein [Polyangiales bacterium]
MKRAHLFALALSLLPATARAGGFYLTDRGVRPLGRGGAFVAGADDQHAIWYNPAGLVDAGAGLLLDASLVNFSNTYTRRARPDAGMPDVSFRSVEGNGAPLPIPTLVLTHNFGLRNAMFAVGALAPYAAITSYPEVRDGPQRYSLISLDGSLLTVVGLWAAWRPHPMVSIGGGVQALLGSFNTRLSFPACPATFTCAPEDPDWDATAQMNVGPIFAPTASLGVQFAPSRYLRFGASGQLPLWVNAPADLAVRLPSASFYDGARVQGSAADVSFRLAPIVRVGIEVRPLPTTRIEVAGVWEGWSLHDSISMTPRDIQINNVRGIGTYEVGPIALDRSFQDTFSVRLGAEHTATVSRDVAIQARAGFQYETSATTPAYTNALTLDAQKFVGSLGASLAWRRWRFDAVFAYMFASSVDVSTSEAALYPAQPFRASTQAPRYPINAGTYELSVNVVGLGARYAF